MPGLDPGPFTGAGSRTYLVGEGRPILVDTGSGVAAYADRLAEALGEEAGPPALVLVTHHHADHQGGLAQVAALAPGAPMWKRPHPKDRVPPARALAGGETIEADGVRLEALFTPGHASDHLCFYWREARALFTGDLILGGSPTIIPVGDGDLAQYLDSLERLLGLDLEVLYPGHGDPITDPHAYIRGYIAHRKMREGQTLDALRAGLHTAAAIAARIYPPLGPGLRRAARDQVFSILLKLEKEGVLVRHPAEPADPGEPVFRLA
ncbi:MAG TPA: MBL fold metallo-hydrolase [Thermodesulfobacteriota bacterium]